jgi:mannose-6-phosphate isomerase
VLGDPVVPACPVAPGVVTWPTPAREFALHRVVLDGDVKEITLRLAGPRLVLGCQGTLSVADGTGSVQLTAGMAGFAPAVAGPLVLSGTGTAYIASVPG